MADEIKSSESDETLKPAHTTEPADGGETLEEGKRLSRSGLSWDQTEAKPGKVWNEVTEMGEGD